MKAAQPSNELKILLRMFSCFLNGYFKFRNSFAHSKGPIKGSGKVCGDSQDIKPPGTDRKFTGVRSIMIIKEIMNIMAVFESFWFGVGNIISKSL